MRLTVTGNLLLGVLVYFALSCAQGHRGHKLFQFGKHKPATLQKHPKNDAPSVLCYELAPDTVLVSTEVDAHYVVCPHTLVPVPPKQGQFPISLLFSASHVLTLISFASLRIASIDMEKVQDSGKTLAQVPI
jgi:hypothetical protein